MALTKTNARSGYSVDLSSYATSTDLNNLTTGKVLQVVSEQLGRTYMDATNSAIGSAGITTTAANSKILVHVNHCISPGGGDGNVDNDLAIGIGWKTGSYTGSQGDYTSITGRNFSRVSANPGGGSICVGGFYATDAYYTGSYDKYDIRQISYTGIVSPSQTSGTLLDFCCFGYSQGSACGFGGSMNATLGDSGYAASITLTEIAS